MNFQIIILSVVAIAFATPIDDKTVTRPSSSNPDISTLPLKNDSNDSVKIQPVQQQGVHAHPLHKRDTPKVAVQASDFTTQSTAKPYNSQADKHQITNNNPQSVLNANGQKPQQTRQTASNSNAQKPQDISTVPRPLVQGNGQQPTLSQSARVRRDAPRVDIQKPINSTPTPDTYKQVTPTVNAQQNTQTTQGSRISREVPKQTDSKAAPKASINSDNKPLPTIPIVASKTSQGTKVKRDAPKTDSKTVTQPTNLSQKPTVAINKASSPQISTLSQPANTSSNKRQARDTPNTAAPSQVNDQKLSDSKATKDETSSNPSAVAKSGSQIPHKRESPASNVREPLQSSSSPSNNQSPSFVHPVPVDQIILKKPTDVSS